MSEIDWDNVFKPGFFYDSGDDPLRRSAHEMANARLRALLKDAPTVHSWKADKILEDSAWYEEGEDYGVAPTHSAKLVMVKEMK